ncbi:ammonia-forming cytochrome c nitrite reductase subunit c552 [Anaeromyxobacter dehalogenans]|uniref:nitrite reductase (cytochrome; ammonia-forming) n=1 Tax=Anaeromyxobacter dehalogenans (strain 2CP-C) TaxID=290397 RepID=Q2IPF3_ANADE|nr:ammonia-forming cytochrome c nitrite reductase subunit c552 [Anaeromyxobacter dehalogenans]ABC80685.1 respiratory nitrite reductase (cytochrome; ammonia-forming) precursor [Anaeromyxobacter dehalogenans 2CP-C]
MTVETQSPRKRALVVGAIAAVFALAAVLAAVVLVDVAQKKAEARNPVVRVVELTDETEDPAIWGKNFPVEYDLYKRTADMVRTKHGGSEAMPRTPSDGDPRSVTAQSKTDADPRLKTMWAGYAFAADFREERGHAYMLDDQFFTQRQVVAKQPGTCGQCHASVYVPMKKLGNGDIFKGFEALNKMPYSEAKQHFKHPVSCIDCHDPASMDLRVTRPGFLEGIRAYKASLGVKDYDPNTMATRQEMRAYVCGQCHVEYYFKGPEKRLTFPWSKGLKADEIVSYYDEVGFKDWVHKESGAPALKAQHPEFEMWNQGIHARSGVACADCHMPYMRVGGTKVSDHQVRSPVLNLNRACQGCHKWPEAELKGRVEAIQDKHMQLREQAFDALVALIGEIKAAREAGKTDDQLVAARYLQRRAQFLFDFVEAENSTGFHAPQESARVLFESIDASRQGQLALRDPSFKPTVAVVNVSTAPAPAAPATPAVVPAVLK